MTPPSAAASVQRGAKLAPPRPRPRRVSGPARPASRPAPRATPRTQREGRASQEGLAVGLLGALESLSSHRLLDRLIRGRMWIGIVAFALIGIVTLQLGLLKLNSGIGRAIERTSALQRENAALSIENSELASGDRVESGAGRLGIKLMPAGTLHFLDSHARTDVSGAAVALRNPVHTTTPSSESSEATSTSSRTEAPPTSETESTQATTLSSSAEQASSTATPETPAEAPSSTTEAQPRESSAPAPGAPEGAEADGGTAGPTG